MGAVLALQFYFFNRAHQQMLEEVSRLTQAFNMATDSYFLEVAGKLPNPVSKIPRVKPGNLPAEFDWPYNLPAREDFDYLINGNVPPSNFKNGRLFLPKKPLLNRA